MDLNELKALGIVLQDSALLVEAYGRHKAQLILPIEGDSLALDLNKLPLKPFPFKEVFLKWALQANEPRLRKGQEPIFPMTLVKMCPLWKLVPAPIIRLDLNKDSLLKLTGKKQDVIGRPQEGALKRSNRK